MKKAGSLPSRRFLNETLRGILYVYCCTDVGRHLESSQPFPRGQRQTWSKLTGEHYCPEIASSVRIALQWGVKQHATETL